MVDIPATTEQAPYGTLINVWNEPLLNVGNTGYDKDLTFDPDQIGVDVLDRAAAEAHQWMMEGYARNGTPIWPDAGRHWRFLLDIPLTESTRVTFVEPGRDLRVDVRAYDWFAMFGPVVPPPPQLYVKTYQTDTGERLNGSHTYRLRVPAKVPTTQFWARSSDWIRTSQIS